MQVVGCNQRMRPEAEVRFSAPPLTSEVLLMERVCTITTVLSRSHAFCRSASLLFCESDIKKTTSKLAACNGVNLTSVRIVLEGSTVCEFR
jgi:hypothetical protein